MESARKNYVRNQKLMAVLESLSKQISNVLPHSLHERLRTHKVFTKDQCFYLNYHRYSIKSHVLDVY